MSDSVDISTIYPTGTCFDDALDVLADWAKKGRHKRQAIFLVHGICLAPAYTIHADEPFAHAWLEVDTKEVWQMGLAKELPDARILYAVGLAEFYKEMRVREATKYTPEAAAKENARTNHYGPWLLKYQMLCGKHRTFWPVGQGPEKVSNK